jgi:hypothetical protein
MQNSGLLSRRVMLAGLGLQALQGCAPPLPQLQTASSTPDAQALLRASAAAHGLAVLQTLNDISVSYTGVWSSLVNRLQPDLVDAGFRGSSQERFLLPGRLVAQSYTGPKGHKEVARQTVPGKQGGVRVWLDGVETNDANRLAAAALVADGYGLFLLGPMLLTPELGGGRWLVMELAPSEQITVFQKTYDCDVLRVRMQPGLGLSPEDDFALYIAHDDQLMRRVRFTLNGLDATKGAVAEVDAGNHALLHGVKWPTLFHERLIRPVPIPVHDWRLTGLDVDRGLTAAEVDGMALTGRALPPAAAVG